MINFLRCDRCKDKEMKEGFIKVIEYNSDGKVVNIEMFCSRKCLKGGGGEDE